MEPTIAPAHPRHVFSESTAPTGTLESFNPATGELVGTVPTITPDQVPAVVAEIAQVQKFWAEMSFEDRGRYVRRAADVLLERKDEIASLITAEQGKVRTEAFGMEIMASVDGIVWNAEHAAEHLSDDKIPVPQMLYKSRKMRFHYEPLGVVGVISPWNYPMLLAMHEISMLLMAGNGVIFKPASLTCLIGQMIQEVFDEAGLPEGLLRTVHGGGSVGQAMVDSPAVKKIFFTGSVPVGRSIAQDCAKQLKPISLELGGKDPMIVLSDANVENAAIGAQWGGFANMGQTCAGIERAYVMHDVAPQFIDLVVEKARTMKLGNPNEWSTEITAMTDPNQYAIVKELVEDAVAHGATLLCGGPIDQEDLPPGHKNEFYFAPTVLTGVNHSMRIMKEEIFGPVVPIITVDSEDEAIKLANDSNFGLGASVWTADAEKGQAIAEKLESGNVWINDHMYTAGLGQCAWGGQKESGVGRSHGPIGFKEAVEVKTIAATPARETTPGAHPYGETVGPSVRTMLDLLYGRGKARIGTLKDGVPAMTRFSARMAKNFTNK